MGTKGDTVFFILTRLGHGWDTVGTRGHWRHRCTRGAREGHERCTRGAREGHKRGTRGAREVHRLTFLRPYFRPFFDKFFCHKSELESGRTLKICLGVLQPFI